LAQGCHRRHRPGFRPSLWLLSVAMSSPRRRPTGSSGSVPLVLPPGVLESELGQQEERDKNRRTLSEIKDRFETESWQHAEFKQAAAAQLQATNAQLEALHAQNRQLMNEMAESRGQQEAMAREFRGMMEQSVGLLTHKTETVVRELTGVRQSLDSGLGSMSDRNRALEGDLHKVKAECVMIKRELHGASEHHKRQRQQQQEIDDLKKGTRSEHQLSRVEAKSELATMEIRQLRHQLHMRGVLAPVRVEVEEEAIEERPPVGAIALGEDIFTARLLLRLGFMVGRQEDEEASLSEEGYDSDVSMDRKLATDNVTGIVVPEVEEGSGGYRKLMMGWVALCGATFCIQLLVLLIMMEQGLDMGECFTEPPDLHRWLLLHVSKALAMVVAGALMGQELMNVVNYWMVAELLFPRRDLEVTITAVMRVLMSFVVVGANVVIFLHLTNPASVWVNMSALGFIVSLGSDALSVSKSGVFGHHISKTITTLNFQLNFVSHYPAWFIYVRGMTIALSAAVVGVFAMVSYVSPDAMCPPDPAA